MWCIVTVMAPTNGVLCPHSLAVWLCCSSLNQEVRPVSPPLDSGLASWLALADRMQQKWHCATSETRSSEVLKISFSTSWSSQRPCGETSPTSSPNKVPGCEWGYLWLQPQYLHQRSDLERPAETWETIPCCFKPLKFRDICYAQEITNITRILNGGRMESFPIKIDLIPKNKWDISSLSGRVR